MLNLTSMGYDVCNEYLQLIRAKIRQGDYDGALMSASKLIRYKQDIPYAFYYHGLCNYALEEYTMAISDYQDAIELDSNFAKAYYNLSLAKYRLGFKNEAIEDLKSARSIFLAENELEPVNKCDEAINYFMQGGEL